MMWWLVVFASAGLIALGIGLLVRDLLLSRSENAKRSKESRASGMSRSSIGAAPNTAPQDGVMLPSGADPREPASSRTGPLFARSTALEKQWTRLNSEIEAAVDKVNRSLGQLAVAIGTPGQATWNLDHDGFGDYRRVRIDRESVAWLRLELGRDLRIRSRLRTHEARFSELNRDAEAPAERVGDEIAQSIRSSLAGVFDFAVKRHSDMLRDEATNFAGASPAIRQNAASAPPTQIGNQQMQAPFPTSAPARPLPETAPSSSAALVDAAVSLVNRAFAEANARLVPAEAASGARAFSGRTLSILAANVPVGYMVIEPRSDRIDISVGMLGQTDPQSLRKRSQPMSGLNLHVLAEAIATQAWPAIAAASARTAVA